MGSTRLPGKVIKPFFHTTLLGWILERLINQPWRVIVATTKNHKDNKIEELCLKKNGQYFRGDEQDVLDRFYRCAVKYKLAHIVRLTADNPFPDTDIIKKLVKLHLSKSADYTHSFGELPIGVGSEIFSFESLEYSWKHGNKKKYREHCNDFILDNPEKFKIEKLPVPIHYHKPKLRLTIDTMDDYEKILGYFNQPPDIYINTKELISICSSSV